MSKVVEFNKVSKTFNEDKIISDLDLSLELNQVTCLFGPTGCGKTTALKIAGGLLRPDLKQSVKWWREGQKQYEPPRPVALVLQDRSLVPWRSALGNVSLPLEIAKKKQDPRVRVKDTLKMVGLEDENDYSKFPHELSGGMRTQVALARAFVIDSPLMLLDEPMVHLDSISKDKILPSMISLIRGSKRSVLYITHNFEEAVLISDKIVLFKEPQSGNFYEIDIAFKSKRELSLRDSKEFRDVVTSLRNVISN